jgi:hypothetical protein
MTANDGYIDELGLSVSVQEEEIVLDEKIMDQFFYHIEGASNEVLKAHDMKDYRMELIVTLLSCSAILALEIDLDNEDLTYILSQTYDRVVEQTNQDREREIKCNFNIN